MNPSALEKQEAYSTVKLQRNSDLQWGFKVNPIPEYANELWQTLTAKDTAITYKQAGAKTWRLLQLTLGLIFFIFLLACAVVLWFWGIGYNLGRSFRIWLAETNPHPDELFFIAIRLIVYPIEVLIKWATELVKNYLGWEVKPDVSEFASNVSNKPQTPPALPAQINPSTPSSGGTNPPTSSPK